MNKILLTAVGEDGMLELCIDKILISQQIDTTYSEKQFFITSVTSISLNRHPKGMGSIQIYAGNDLCTVKFAYKQKVSFQRFQLVLNALIAETRKLGKCPEEEAFESAVIAKLESTWKEEDAKLAEPKKTKQYTYLDYLKIIGIIIGGSFIFMGWVIGSSGEAPYSYLILIPMGIVFMPIFSTIAKIATKSRISNTGLVARTVSFVCLFALLCLFVSIEIKVKEVLAASSKPAPSKAIETKPETSNFEVIGVEDGGYMAQDPNTGLATNVKRKSYRIVVPLPITREKLDQAINEMISARTSSDPDIDEILLWVYSDKSLSKNPYDVAMATWGVNGQFGYVTEKMARENTRDGYQTKIDIASDFEKFQKLNSKKETKFGLTEEQRMAAFRDVMLSETLAVEKSEAKYPAEDAKTKEAMEAQYLQKEQFENAYNAKYDAIHRKKYKITEAQLDAIRDEGYSKHWPLPEVSRQAP